MDELKERLMENMTENLPVLRKKLKLSQENLAEKIGVSRYTVMLIETRKRKMTWNMFLSLILLFDKSAETAPLLRALQIYTDELDEMISTRSNTDEEKTETVMQKQNSRGS